MKYSQIIKRAFGIVGALAWIVIYARTPSFPTPDKLLILGVFLAMALGQTWEFAKRFVPFVVLLLVYESFRGLVPHLNNNVDYTILPAIDKIMFFGHLPTILLQDLLWNGYVRWYDFVFYLAYMLHFVIPLVLAVVVWKTKAREYWRLVTTYISVSFAGFLTFLVFPASPPWLASDKGLIEPLHRISSDVWFALGVNDFPSVYNKISPNPVAAMPSLHAAYATVFAIFMVKLYKSKWSYLAWIYPLLIYVGTVYLGEHYFIDEVVGALYAIVGFWTAPKILKYLKTLSKNIDKSRSRMFK